MKLHTLLIFLLFSANQFFMSKAQPSNAANCPPGTYQDQEGQSSCKECASGQYQDQSGQSSCKTCASPMVIVDDRCIDNRVYKERTSDNCETHPWDKITSAAACGAGATELGWWDTTATTESSSDYPPGCYYDYYFDVLYFNPDNTNYACSLDSKCLCTFVCPPGTYQDQAGKSTCKSCPSDTFNNIAGAPFCPFDATSCPTGTYASGTDTVCDLCGAGKYNNQTNQTACKSCAAGEYQNEEGKASCNNDCASPMVITLDARCIDNRVNGDACPSGTYQDEIGQYYCKTCANSTYSDVGASSCLLDSTTCPAGTYDSGTDTVCDSCGAGKYNDQTSQTSKSVACKSCAAGKYQNEEGQASCNNDCASPMVIVDARCIDNTVYQERRSDNCGDSAGEGKITSAAACGAGATALGWSETWAYTESDPDYPPGCYSEGDLYFNTANSNVACSNDNKCLCTLVCPPSTYQNQSGQSSCKTCTNGTYSTAGASSCPYSATTCPVGTYASGTDTVCDSCGAGKYNNQTNQTSESVACKSCDVGEYQNEEGKASCNNDCVSPMVITVDASRCINNRVNGDACPSGTYQDEIGQSFCKTCANSTYSTVGAPSCPYSATTCPVGTYASGTAACASCGTGKYNDQTNQTSESVACKSCAAGQYQNEEGKASCNNDCASPMVIVDARCIDNRVYQKRLSGRCGDSAGEGKITSAAACGAGATALGLWAPTPWAPTPYAVSYSERPPGCFSEYDVYFNTQMYFNTQNPNVDCSNIDICLCTLTCPSGTYQDQSGQSSCKTCANSTYSDVGASSCLLDSTTCPAGTYDSGTDTVCDSCGAGKYNDQTSQTACKSCATGEYQNEEGQASCNNDCVSPMVITVDARCIDNRVYKERTCGLCVGNEGYITSADACSAAAAALGWSDTTIASTSSRDDLPPGCFHGGNELFFNTNNPNYACRSNEKCLCTRTCPPGTYQDQSGQSSCKTCASGQYQEQSGQSSCKSCRSDTYQDQAGKGECKECPHGTYQDQEGKGECINFVKGCTYVAASNYNVDAELDDGNCTFNQYQPPPVCPTSLEYCNSTGLQEIKRLYHAKKRC